LKREAKRTKNRKEHLILMMSWKRRRGYTAEERDSILVKVKKDTFSRGVRRQRCFNYRNKKKHRLWGQLTKLRHLRV